MFGGTWTQITDKFLLGASSTYALGTTGGESTHTLTIAEMTSHFYNSAAKNKTNEGFVTRVDGGGSPNTTARCVVPYLENVTYYSAFITGNTGGDRAHNIMPPYLSVNILQRTS